MLADRELSTLGLLQDFLKYGLNWEGVLTGDTMARGAIGKVMLSTYLIFVIFLHGQNFWRIKL